MDGSRRLHRATSEKGILTTIESNHLRIIFGKIGDHLESECQDQLRNYKERLQPAHSDCVLSRLMQLLRPPGFAILTECRFVLILTCMFATSR